MTVHATRFYRQDGVSVRALQFDGRVASFEAFLVAFPGRIAPHPHRDDALLVRLASGRQVRVEASTWVSEAPGGEIRTAPDDQFRIDHTPDEARAA